MTTPCRLPATAYSLLNLFADLLHIWRPSPPSVSRVRVMPWWKGPTSWLKLYNCVIQDDYKWCERFLPINLCNHSHHL
jgi:hypothetical protein